MATSIISLDGFKTGDSFTVTKHLFVTGGMWNASNLEFSIPINRNIISDSLTIDNLYLTVYNNNTRVISNVDVANNSSYTLTINGIDKNLGIIDVNLSGFSLTQYSQCTIDIRPNSVITFN